MKDLAITRKTPAERTGGNASLDRAYGEKG